MKMRFGIDEKGDYTLEEVGKVFDVTRERIRQIEFKALRKLRHPVAFQATEGHLERVDIVKIPAPSRMNIWITNPYKLNPTKSVLFPASEISMPSIMS